MNILQTILAIFPGILICAWIIYKDRHEPEPLLLVFCCLIAGALSAFPTIYLEKMGIHLFNIPNNPENVFETLLLTIGVVGLSEELIKLTCLMLLAFPMKAFNEPLDGIVYAIMIGMGFAITENIIYANTFGMDTVLLRAFTAVPAHAAFAIFMGYHVGLAKFSSSKRGRIRHLLEGFLGAILIHGIYDFFLLQTWIPELSILGLVVLIICIFYTRKLLHLHYGQSLLEKRDRMFDDKV